nr:MAG TPA: hypothetical protein [Caudoviricetes sp.]
MGIKELHEQGTLPKSSGRGLKFLQTLRKVIAPLIFCTRVQNWRICRKYYENHLFFL